jgi:predicted ATPase
MLIKVIGPKERIPSNAKDADFYLKQDLWNDYSFQTLYHLHLSGHWSSDNEPIYIGAVKILKKGQTEKDYLQVGTGSFITLSPDFCSLGQSLDYYERIAQLNSKMRDDLLNALRDVVIIPKYAQGFNTEEGWKTSLFRYISEDDDIFTIAPMLMSGDFTQLPSLELKFSFQVAGMNEPVSFDFDAPKFGRNNEQSLPNRVAVLIGKNGSGKSTLLAKISRVAFASTTNRQNTHLSKVGQIVPEGLGFPKIIALSYSAFDSFQVPGIYIREKQQIAKDIKRGVGRYIFCGIRDVVKELEEHLANLEGDKDGGLPEHEILRDRHNRTYLKSIDELAIEFSRSIMKINADQKWALFNLAEEKLSEETSCKNILNKNFFGMKEEDLSEYFLHLSTGHKFVLHSVAKIIEYIEPRSLILFDEPETHLHPPLLAVLMQAIRAVLSEKNGFMIVATHSPVVPQETLSKNVFVIRREGSEIKIAHPTIATFGENIGIITSHVFNLSTEITNYHSVLDNVIRGVGGRFFSGSQDQLYNDITELFGKELSSQARAYLMSRIYNND